MDFDFIAYVKNLASSHKLIKHTDADAHFYIITSLEKLEGLLNNPKTNYPVICANDDDSGRFNDNGADMVFDRKPFSFYVFMKSKNQLDMNERNVNKEICRRIGFDFMTKIKADKKNDMLGLIPKTGLRNVDLSSVTYFMVGPLLDGVIGYEFFFSMNEKPDLKFDDKAWDEIKAVPVKLNIGWFTDVYTALLSGAELKAGNWFANANCNIVFKANCRDFEYIYFYVPLSYLPENGISFWVNGFCGGFEVMENVMVNHGDAGLIEYVVYRSENYSLGYCIVNVTEN